MTDFFHFEDIQRAGKVVKYNDIKKILERTEPVLQHILQTDGSNDVKVTMPDDWNHQMKSLDDSVKTSCTIQYNDSDRKYFLTKRAMLSLLSMIGISDRYAYKTPGHLLESHVNYWFRNGGVGPDPDVKMLTKDDIAVAFMRVRHPVVSNLELLEQIRRFFKKRPDDPQLYFDPNIVNNYVETDFRIILPKVEFEVKTKRNGEEVVDKWHFGVHVSNSLIASMTKPLTLSGFMVEQRSLAGILPEYSQVTHFARGNDMDPEDLRGWIHSTLSQVFAILPVEAEIVQSMPEHSLSGKVGSVTTDLFRTMKIHRKVQEDSLENLTESGDMTSYGVMHALAKSVAVASTKFPPKIINHVQRVSGSLPARAEELCESCGRLHLFD